MTNLLPSHIHIGGITYDVKGYATENKNTHEKCASGLCDKETNTIYIDNELSQEQKELTLIHEILHALNGEIDEVTVDHLAFGLHAVLKQNKWL